MLNHGFFYACVHLHAHQSHQFYDSSICVSSRFLTKCVILYCCFAFIFLSFSFSSLSVCNSLLEAPPPLPPSPFPQPLPPDAALIAALMFRRVVSISD
mmetsp:Transcript_28410/g.43513  ORF Transcript_28410/g.43513 Transcript_28410/m.43513 type:complete len:98 (+) Transcript_28410:39-332(+)